jgi:hypothetical protein
MILSPFCAVYKAMLQEIFDSEAPKNEGARILSAVKYVNPHPSRTPKFTPKITQLWVKGIQQKMEKLNMVFICSGAKHSHETHCAICLQIHNGENIKQVFHDYSN